MHNYAGHEVPMFVVFVHPQGLARSSNIYIYIIYTHNDRHIFWSLFENTFYEISEIINQQTSSVLCLIKFDLGSFIMLIIMLILLLKEMSEISFS